jgi:hypothetical protein
MTELRIPAAIPAEALSKLQQSGEPLSEDVLKRARAILAILDIAPVTPPFVFPTDIGGVQFEWHGEKRELDIEILPEKTKLDYVAFEDGIAKLEGEADPDESSVLQLVKWLRQKTPHGSGGRFIHPWEHCHSSRSKAHRNRA